MKSIQEFCIILIFINGYMSSDSDSDYIDVVSLTNNKLPRYKSPQTTTTITTTTKARKRQKSHNEQINSDDDVIEIKRPDVEIYFKSPRAPTTTTTKLPDVFEIIPDIIDKDKSTTTTTTTKKRSKYNNGHMRSGNIAEFIQTFRALPNRTNNRYNINKQILEQYNFRGGLFNSIVFNCKTPSVISFARRITSLKNINILEQLKKKAVCNRFTPNGTRDEYSVWLENGKFDSPIILTCVNRSICQDKDEFHFGFSYPISYLFDYFIDFNLCELFLKYLGHPYYYSYSPIKPTLCDRKIF